MTIPAAISTFRIRPVHLQVGMALTIAGWLGLSLATISGYSLPPKSAGMFVNFSSMAAYALALPVCWAIQKEYRHSRWFRFAWLALGMSASLSFLRHSLDTGLPALWWTGLTDRAIAGFARHLIVVPGTLALLLGLLTMWLCVRRTGLGFDVLGRDLAAISVLLAVLAGTWYYRERLSQAASPLSAARQIQHAHILLLFCCSAMSILYTALSAFLMAL